MMMKKVIEQEILENVSDENVGDWENNQGCLKILKETLKLQV
ncbi:hypothetical protein SAMN05661086_01279 [Anaeromicropila populeti]|uniref:Uncharacterized protein n=2 Tax=Anaeromicropila populeti TaxID=37658 RepID=A0A1I6IZA1_9FIRM|nr:hypothetical protein SAMN05661086_01279 [Anaeromicropila populeti]